MSPLNEHDESMANDRMYAQTPHQWQTFRVQSVEDLLWFSRKLRDPRRFIYRGHRNEARTFEPKIVRNVPDSFKETMGIQVCEQRIPQQFKSRAYHYLPIEQLPKDDDYVEWLALIQHYGGPTRLLDFTFSIFVATYFAVGARNLYDEAAVWAVNQQYMASNFAHKQREHSSCFHHAKHSLAIHNREMQANDLLRAGIDGQLEVPATILISPTRHNRRLLQQQGLFIAPLSVNSPFIDSLAAMFRPIPDLLSNQTARGVREFDKFDECAVIKLVISKDRYAGIRRDLRGMNIRTESLFPNLEGEVRALDDIVTDAVFVEGVE